MYYISLDLGLSATFPYLILDQPLVLIYTNKRVPGKQLVLSWPLRRAEYDDLRLLNLLGTLSCPVAANSVARSRPMFTL